VRGAIQDALTDAEIDRLADRLAANPNPDALSLEAVDGLFCALIAAPDAATPSGYLPVILGGGRSSSRVFKDLEDANDALSLLMRYWNSIAQDFAKESVHLAYLLKASGDGVPGCAWARGYMRGTRLAPRGWSRIFSDEREGLMLTIPLAAGEVDPAWPKEPLTDERSDELLKQMLAAAGRAYNYFREERSQRVQASFEGKLAPTSPPYERAAVKVGRNDPCPCGSGKKYKKCCGSAGGGTMH
jgi:uncharacterized protein